MAVGSNPVIPIAYTYYNYAFLFCGILARELGNFDGQSRERTIGVENKNGERAVMAPADDELIRLYTDHEEASDFWGLAIW